MEETGFQILFHFFATLFTSAHSTASVRLASKYEAIVDARQPPAVRSPAARSSPRLACRRIHRVHPYEHDPEAREIPRHDDTIYFLLDILSQHIFDPDASPALCGVVLTYGLVHRENQLPTPDPLSLVALDEGLAAHPEAPSILWRFNFKLNDGERHSTELKDVLTAWMPMMQESERLLFEDYTDLTDGY
ncbi:hypothetical protein C8J57DRAFT_1620943 [Mycena rebaudengoi]|nr:hypothetical protein C8J57DRAFT_1620943 [Mycena rebaudengoi]